MWQGVRDITDYKQSNPEHPTSTDPTPSDQLNTFFARFEDCFSSSSGPDPEADSFPESNQTLTLQTYQVNRALLNINCNKATRPDGVSGQVLTCLKTATIIPVPKTSTITNMNDYRPVALTPVILKCLMRLVLSHIRACIPPDLDQHQFTYWAYRTHLENPNSYVRMLFVDYSSVFNTINPIKLINTLQTLGLGALSAIGLQTFSSTDPSTSDQTPLLLHHHSQHWCPPRLYPQSNPLLSLHT